MIRQVIIWIHNRLVQWVWHLLKGDNLHKELNILRNNIFHKYPMIAYDVFNGTQASLLGCCLPVLPLVLSPHELPFAIYGSVISCRHKKLLYNLLSTYNTWDPFYLHGSTWIPAWKNNYICHKVWDEITDPFPNFNGGTIEVCEWISNFIPRFTGPVITYPC